MPLNLLALAVGTGLLSGVASLVGRALGAGDLRKVAAAGRAALFLGLLCAAILGTGLILGADALIDLFAGPSVGQEARAAAKTYLLGVIPAYALLPFELALLGLLMGEGKTVAYGTAMALGTVVNLALDPLFMFVLGWGVAGAAIATSLATLAATLYIVRMGAKEAGRFGLRRRENGEGDVRRMAGESRTAGAISIEIVRVGIPQALSLLVVSLTFMFLNRVLGGFGETSLNAWIVVGRVEECVLMIAYAVGSAGMFMASTACGAGKRKELDESIDRCLRTALAVCAVVVLPYIALAPIIFRAFSGNAAVVKACAFQVRSISWSTAGVVVSLVAASILQGMGKPGGALLIIVLRLGLLLLAPVAALSVSGLLTLPLFFAIFAASSVGGGLMAVLSLKRQARTLPETAVPALSSASA
jgi:putative MATE family efflux protein